AAAQRPRDRLAAHREEMRDEPCEAPLVLDVEARRSPRHEPHERGAHARRRRERAGTDVEARFDIHPLREHNREPAVFLAAGRGGGAGAPNAMSSAPARGGTMRRPASPARSTPSCGRAAIWITCGGATRSGSGAVSAPSPPPISTIGSSRSGAIVATILRITF